MPSLGLALTGTAGDMVKLILAVRQNSDVLRCLGNAAIGAGITGLLCITVVGLWLKASALTYAAYNLTRERALETISRVAGNVATLCAPSDLGPYSYLVP